MHLYKRAINLFHEIYFARCTLNEMPLKISRSFCLIYDEEWPLIVRQLSLTQSMFRCKRVMTWTLPRRADLVYTWRNIGRMEKYLKQFSFGMEYKPNFKSMSLKISGIPFYYPRVHQYKGSWIKKSGKACVRCDIPTKANCYVARNATGHWAECVTCSRHSDY
jgi:hypothetical protein